MPTWQRKVESRRDFLKLVGLSAASLAVSGCAALEGVASGPQNSKPNVMMVVIDDLNDPRKPSTQEMFDDSKGYDFDPKFELPVFKALPYKMMIPRPVSNLVCAGRITSVERQVLGITRDISPAMAMGEAAGVAAKLAIEGNTSFSHIDTSQLTDQLRQRGCIIDRADLPESTQRNDFE